MCLVLVCLLVGVRRTQLPSANASLAKTDVANDGANGFFVFCRAYATIGFRQGVHPLDADRFGRRFATLGFRQGVHPIATAARDGFLITHVVFLIRG